MQKNITDIFRGMYVGLPTPAKKVVEPFLAMLPVSIKYGSTYKQLSKLIEKGVGNAQLIHEYRNAIFRDIIQICNTKSVYYQKLFADTGLIVEDLQYTGFDAIANIPILTKDTLRENVLNLLTVPKYTLDQVSTSGSSGMPLIFYLDKNRSVKEWAFIHHIWSKAGYHPYDKRAVLRGVHIDNADKRPWVYDLALKELLLSPFHLTQANIEAFLIQISKRHIKYIHGYPSALVLLARHVLRYGWNYNNKIIGIFPISESLYLYQRDELKEAFPNSKILPFYGLSEKVAIAGELDDQPDVYEFEPLYGITELVGEDGNEIRTPGQKGNIVSTSLLNYGMPLIRYDTQDEAVLVQAPDESNAYRLRVKDIRSRWSQEYIYGKNGEPISIAAINIHSSAYSYIKEFQFHQQIIGVVEVWVVPIGGVDKSAFRSFVGEIQKKVGESVHFVLKEVDKIDRNARGKTKFIVQHMDMSQFR